MRSRTTGGLVLVALVGCASALPSARVEQHVTIELAAPVLPTHPLASGYPFVCVGGGDRAAFGDDDGLVLLDPRRTSEAIRIDGGSPYAIAFSGDASAVTFGSAAATGGGLYVASALRGFPSISLAIDGDLPIPAFVGEEVWAHGSDLRRFWSDGTLLVTLDRPARGCVGDREGGAWLAELATDGVSLVPVDATGLAVGAAVPVELPEFASGCEFRRAGSESAVCFGFSSGEVLCALVDEIVAGSASWHSLPRLYAGGASTLAGYLHPVELFSPSVGRWDPTTGEDVELGSWLDEVRCVVEAAGTPWVIATTESNRVTIAGELIGPGVTIGEQVVLAAPVEELDTEVRAAVAPDGSLVAAWQRPLSDFGRDGRPLVLEGSCGLLRVSLSGDVVVRDDPRACSAVVARLGASVVLVAADTVFEVADDLSLTALALDRPPLPFLAGRDVLLFGAVDCPAGRCELRVQAVSRESGAGAVIAHEVACDEAPSAVTTAASAWGSVVALECGAEGRIFVLDREGRRISEETRPLAPSFTDRLAVLASGSRLVVVIRTVDARSVLSFADGRLEREIELPLRPWSGVWPAGDFLLVPLTTGGVDLGSGVLEEVEGIPYAVPASAVTHDGLDAGSGFVWVRLDEPDTATRVDDRSTVRFGLVRVVP